MQNYDIHDYDGRYQRTLRIREDSPWKEKNPRKRILEFASFIICLRTLAKNNQIKRRKAIFSAFLKIAIMKFFRIRPSGIIKLAGWNTSYGDINTLYNIFITIFINRDYAFSCSSDSPLIVDAGANIGMATLYFKYQHPQSSIICFEPDPANFHHLKYNVSSNALANVELHNVALYDRDGSVSLFLRNDIKSGDIAASVHAKARYYYYDEQEIREIIVPCQKLSKYLENEDAIDLLKLDIEGAESVVLEEIEKHLPRIKNVVLEYHFVQEENPLHHLLRVLRKKHHHYNIQGLDGDDIFWGSTLLIRSKHIKR